MTHYIAQGNLKPDLVLTLYDPTGRVVDFTAATSVRVVITLDQTPLVDVTSPDVSLTTVPDCGRIVRVWQPGDTATGGTLAIYVEIDWGGGVKQRFPTTGTEEGFITVG